MSKIPFSMINRKTSDNSGQMITLDGIFDSCQDGLMYIFSGGDYTKQKILEAIDYLKSVGGGSFFIPEIGNVKRTKIEVYKDSGIFYTRFIYYDFKPPSGGQARPYLGTEWKSGDIIYNQDLSFNTNYVWVCSANGIPGVWVKGNLGSTDIGTNISGGNGNGEGASSGGGIDLVHLNVEVYGLSSSDKFTGYPYTFRYPLGMCSNNYYAMAYTSDWDYEFIVETGNGYVDFFFTHNFNSTVNIDLMLFNTSGNVDLADDDEY